MTEGPDCKASSQVCAVLAQLTAGLRSILGEQLIGIYLYGSLITGDFLPSVSDIDLVVVLKEALNQARFEKLHQLHENVTRRRPEWEDRLELAYIAQSALRTFRSQTSIIGIISPGEPFHLISAGADWLISWYALRENGFALFGPPVQSLFAPIAAADYLRAVHEHINGYRRLAAETSNRQFLSYIVLTVARGHYTLQHGEPTSKIKAAAWAGERYPQWSALLEIALALRADAGHEAPATAQLRIDVEAFVAFVLAEALKAEFSALNR
ncbi:MAG: DUF4111 domain-containing protein [Chloroflexi bacterium]|nr:DUF4111 domain-containing protein [Chloroflexota bacterium]